MLRLEKGTRQNPLVISFRERPIVFSRELINAFMIALGIHLFAFILFHVSPFRVRNPEVILPQSLVHIEMPQSEGQISTEIDEYEPRLRTPLAPEWTIPALPEMPETSSFNENFLASMEPMLKKSFRDDLYFNPSSHLSVGPRMRVNISGPLADCMMDTFVYAELDKMKLGRQCYAVKVEAETGKIFWYKQLEGSKEGKLEAEHLLSLLQFHPTQEGIFLSGEVEIVYD